jgi:hypothetical protein
MGPDITMIAPSPGSLAASKAYLANTPGFRFRAAPPETTASAISNVARFPRWRHPYGRRSSHGV